MSSGRREPFSGVDGFERPGILDRLRDQARAFAVAAERWAAADESERPAQLRDLERVWAEIGVTLRRAGIPLAAAGESGSARM